MKVIFEYKDASGKVLANNNIEKELTNDEILVLLNSKEVDYPVNKGFSFSMKNYKLDSQKEG